MPVNPSFTPPVTRLHTAVNAIGTALTPIVEIVRYFLRLPDEETFTKVVYIEFVAPIVMENESIESNQRTWSTFNIAVYGVIFEKDVRILADFIEEVENTLFKPANVTSYYNAFASWDGFSIDRLTVSEVGFGENYGQFKMLLECSLFAPNE
jgi:hypothetical protein